MHQMLYTYHNTLENFTIEAEKEMLHLFLANIEPIALFQKKINYVSVNLYKSLNYFKKRENSVHIKDTISNTIIKGTFI